MKLTLMVPHIHPPTVVVGQHVQDEHMRCTYTISTRRDAELALRDVMDAHQGQAGACWVALRVYFRGLGSPQDQRRRGDGHLPERRVLK